jgi:hypothetical protein
LTQSRSGHSAVDSLHVTASRSAAFRVLEPKKRALCRYGPGQQTTCEPTLKPVADLSRTLAAGRFCGTTTSRVGGKVGQMFDAFGVIRASASVLGRSSGAGSMALFQSRRQPREFPVLSVNRRRGDLCGANRSRSAHAANEAVSDAQGVEPSKPRLRPRWPRGALVSLDGRYRGYALQNPLKAD